MGGIRKTEARCVQALVGSLITLRDVKKSAAAPSDSTSDSPILRKRTYSHTIPTPTVSRIVPLCA